MDAWPMILACRKHQYPGGACAPDFLEAKLEWGIEHADGSISPLMCLKTMNGNDLENCRTHF